MSLQLRKEVFRFLVRYFEIGRVRADFELLVPGNLAIRADEDFLKLVVVIPQRKHALPRKLG